MGTKLEFAPRSGASSATKADCPHRRLARLGIQRFPVAPYRVFLLRCHACGTSVSTRTLRDATAPAPVAGR